MIITLEPQRNDNGPLTVSKQGESFTIDGVEYDFQPLPDGALLPREAVDCPWLISDVKRIDGELEFSLLFPHGGNAPEETRFPSPIIDPADGPIPLPPFDAEPEQ